MFGLKRDKFARQGRLKASFVVGVLMMEEGWTTGHASMSGRESSQSGDERHMKINRSLDGRMTAYR